MLELEKFLEYEQPTKYIVNDDNYDDSYEIPVLTAGQSFILGYTNEQDNVFPIEKLPVLIFDDFTTSVQYVDFPFKVKSSAMKILHPTEKANIKYFYYLLKSIKVNNSTHKRYWISEYSKFKVKFKSLSEQQDIVERLETITKAIDNRKKMIDDCHFYLHSIFNSMFGNLVSNDKKYSIKTLNEVADISSSKRIYAKEYVSCGVPFYRSTEIIELSSGKKPKSELYISLERYNEIKEKYGVPKIGDILITAVGTIGKTWIVKDDAPFYYKDGNLILIHLREKISQVYFKYALDILIENFKKRNVNGTSYSALTIEKFKGMDFVLPPFELQVKFENIVQHINFQIAQYQKDIDDLEQLLQIKMNEYFS